MHNTTRYYKTARWGDERTRLCNLNGPLHGDNGKTSDRQQKRQCAGRHKNNSTRSSYSQRVPAQDHKSSSPLQVTTVMPEHQSESRLSQARSKEQNNLGLTKKQDKHTARRWHKGQCSTRKAVSQKESASKTRVPKNSKGAKSRGTMVPNAQQCGRQPQHGK